jgi:uncharacterized membrane protein
MAAFVERSIWGSTLLAALGTGLVGGVFFAFSSFIMKALAHLPAAKGIAAMQAINVAVINPLFMGVLFGTALLCLLLAAYSLTSLGHSGSYLLLTGSLLYLLGAIAVTVIFNVPLNDALARVDPESTAGASLWASFLTTWSAWNTVRTVGSVLASAAFIAALCRLPAAN